MRILLQLSELKPIIDSVKANLSAFMSLAESDEFLKSLQVISSDADQAY